MDALRVQPGRLSKCDFRPSCQKEVHPAFARFLATDSLGFLSNRPFAEGVRGVRIKRNPVNKDVFCLRGKKLLRAMGLPIRTGDPKKAVTKGISTP